MSFWTQFLLMIDGVLANPFFRVSLLAMILAQVLKIFFYYHKNRKFNFRVFVQPSGMPSSHSSMVMALTAIVGLAEGWASPTFAVALVFSIIVMYDAAGVRQAAGKQARILNKMMDDFSKNKKLKEDRLKEFLGHTPTEVFAGGLLGVIVAFLYYYAWGIAW